VPGLDEEDGDSLDDRLAAVEGEGPEPADAEQIDAGFEEPTFGGQPPVDEPADEDESEAEAPSIDAEPTTVASLAAEIRDGSVSEADLAVLRETLAPPEGSSSSEAQIAHLQARVSELDAYADAFSAFLDENGTGEELLEQSRERHESVEEDLRELEARVEALSELEAEIESVDESVRDLEAPIDELRGKLVGVRSDVAAMEEDLDELDADLPERIAAVRVDVEEVQESVEEIESWRDQLGEMFSG
jgi:DNA repair exonuclease SbcCD ATPase subunit